MYNKNNSYATFRDYGDYKKIEVIPISKRLFTLFFPDLSDDDYKRDYNNSLAAIKNIYYNGKGYKIGEIDRRELHIGKQSTGSTCEDIYFNVILLNTKPS